MNRRGIEAVKSVLKEARKIARTLPPGKRAAIEQMCDEIEALMQELADLQARGLVRGGGGGRKEKERGGREEEREYAGKCLSSIYVPVEARFL